MVRASSLALHSISSIHISNSSCNLRHKPCFTPRWVDGDSGKYVEKGHRPSTTQYRNVLSGKQQAPVEVCVSRRA